MHNFFQTKSPLAESSRNTIRPCSTQRQQFRDFPIEVQAGNNAKLP
jgi:hypothetical protein